MSRRVSTGLILVVAGLGLYSWAACVVIAWRGAELGQGAEHGQFGDTFGVVNALFTMVAMIGAAIAVKFQWEELADARKSKADDLREQRFFQLIGLLQTANAGVNIDTGSQVDGSSYLSGYAAFEHVISRMLPKGHRNSYEFLKAVPACNQWLSFVGLLLDFIAKSESEQKHFFLEVARSQFSDFQIKFLTTVACYDPACARLRSTLLATEFWDAAAATTAQAEL